MPQTTITFTCVTTDSDNKSVYTGTASPVPSPPITGSRLKIGDANVLIKTEPSGKVTATSATGANPLKSTGTYTLTYGESSGNGLTEVPPTGATPVAPAGGDPEAGAGAGSGGAVTGGNQAPAVADLDPKTIGFIKGGVKKFFGDLNSQIKSFEVTDPSFQGPPDVQIAGTYRSVLDALFTIATGSEADEKFNTLGTYVPVETSGLGDAVKTIIQGIKGELGPNRKGGLDRVAAGKKSFEGIPQILEKIAAAGDEVGNSFKSFLIIGSKNKFSQYFNATDATRAQGIYDTVTTLAKYFGADTEFNDKIKVLEQGLSASDNTKLGIAAAEVATVNPDAQPADAPAEAAGTSPPAGGTSAPTAAEAISAADLDKARVQIVSALNEVPKIFDDPGSVKDLPFGGTGILKRSINRSSFKPTDGDFYIEIKKIIGDIESKKTVSTPSSFVSRSNTDENVKEENDFLATKIKEKGTPVVQQILAKSPEALRLLNLGANKKLDGNKDAKDLYDATIAFATLFDMQADIEKFAKDTVVSADGNTVTPPPVPGTSAAGSASAAVGGVSGGGSGSASSNGGSAQPGAAAEVTDIAVAAVRILNARPAPVQVFMDFGPPRSGDIEQPLPLQWTIDPAYFSGYQLQINDSQRAIIAQYKNQQVILRVSATPLTGGRPVEVKQPLSIRTYRLPDQAELIPIKTFTFGRLAGTQSVSPEPAAQGGARDFSKRVAEVPCFFYKADGGVGAPAGDAVGVTSAASGRTYRFDFPEGFLVPIRIKFDDAKNPKTASKLEKLRQEQGLLSESKGKLLKEAGVPHWIFLKRRGALDSGRGGAGGGADAGADADAAGGLRVNIAVKTIVISTTDKLRVVGNSGNPWDASSFKAAFYPGKGAQFDKDEFPNAGLILCDDDFGLFSGLDRGAVMTAMYRVLFTDRAPDSSAYKLVGLQKWADDIRVIGSNPEVSATARRKPDNLFASA